MKAFRRFTLPLISLSLLMITGCAALFQDTTHRRKSSVVEYLYPRSRAHVDEPGVPVLSLPLRVGIAFVPDNTTDRNADTPYHLRNYPPFTEKQKIALMQRASETFKRYPFVKSIELIPSIYLAPQGGFENLDQIRSMFGVDVIALLSYDQAQFTDEGWLSIGYWTVVGAYVIQGEKNDTKTMIDAVVYDVASRKLLFRAPGISQIKASATPVNLSEELRDDSERGFRDAAADMVANLQEQLSDFKDRIKKEPEAYKVVTRPGYTAAGALGAVDVSLAGALALLCWCSQKTRRK